MNQDLTNKDRAFLKQVIANLNDPTRVKTLDDPYEEERQIQKREKDFNEIVSFFDSQFPTLRSNIYNPLNPFHENKEPELKSNLIISNQIMNSLDNSNVPSSNIGRENKLQRKTKSIVSKNILKQTKEMQKIIRHQKMLEKQLAKVNKINENLKKLILKKETKEKKESKKHLKGIPKLFDLTKQLKEENIEFKNRIYKNNALLYKGVIDSKTKKNIKETNRELRKRIKGNKEILKRDKNKTKKINYNCD